MDRPEWPEDPSTRFVIHLALRSERLCGGPHECPDSPEPDEDGQDRCPECPLHWIDDQLSSTTQKGTLLKRALELDAALQYGVTVGLDEIDCQEFRVLKMIRLERSAYEKEEMERK